MTFVHETPESVEALTRLTPINSYCAAPVSVRARLRSTFHQVPPCSWAGAANLSDAIRNYPVTLVEAASGNGSRLMPLRNLGASHRTGSPSMVLGVFRGASRGFDTKTGSCLFSGSLIRPQQSDRAGSSVSIQLARGVKAPSLFVCPPTALQCSGERVSKSFECVLHDVISITHGVSNVVPFTQTVVQ